MVKSVQLSINGMFCTACARFVEQTVMKLPGIEEASVKLPTEELQVRFEESRLSLRDIRTAITKAGYEALDRCAEENISIPIEELTCAAFAANTKRVVDRRIQKTEERLRDSLLSLILEQEYESITIQQILDKANVGRSTFYIHYKNKDDLLLSEVRRFQNLLATAQQHNQENTRRPENILSFSYMMFVHAHGYRDIYHALCKSKVWPRVRLSIQSSIHELIGRECKSEIQKMNGADSDVPVDLFVHYLTSTFMSVMTWWLDRKSRLSPNQINEIYRNLVMPSVSAVLS